MFISIIALLVYFIWGQGLTCAWWMYLIFGSLILLVLSNSKPVLQWILSLFLLGITIFAPATFGYSEVQKNCYNRGLADGKLVKEYGLSQDPEGTWELLCDQSSGDEVPKCKRYYMKGWDDAK